MNKREILEVLSDAINLCDETSHFGLGDRLYEVIDTLKKEWQDEIYEAIASYDGE